MVSELIPPRICHIPEAHDTSIGDQAVEWARSHKMKLDVEQEWVLRKSFGLRENGRWQTPDVCFNAPRQNGKGEVLIARELFGLYVLGEEYIVHSAHEFKTAERHFQRLEAVIRNNEDLLTLVKRAPTNPGRIIGFRFSHGDEAVELQDGRRIEFRTRTKAGMRGFDNVALLVLDEAMILSEWAYGSMLPTVRASRAEHGPQLWHAGSAADQETHEHSIIWTLLREQGIGGSDDDLMYVEWSLPFVHPDDAPDEIISDPELWRSVNWAIERGRVDEAWMAREFRRLPRRQFCVELLGIGDYPDPDLLGNSEISDESWLACENVESVLQDPVCVSFDVSPGRRTTISAGGLSGERKQMVEVVACRAGVGWVPEFMVALCEKHDVVEIVCDGFGPGNTIATRIEEQTGLTVRRLKSGEYADACGQFANAVEERELVHIGQDELNTAVKGARTRPLVDRWAWSRSKSKTDPGPLIASSIALWSMVDRDVANREEMMIF